MKLAMVLLVTAVVLSGCIDADKEVNLPAISDVANTFEEAVNNTRTEIVPDQASSQAEAFTEPVQEIRKETRGELKGCVGEGPVTFSHAPADTDNIELIVPLGQMSSAHVTPTDHQYYYLKAQGTAYAPAAGVITSIQAMPGSNNNDYRIVLHHTCTFYTIYIHVNTLSPKILEAVGNMNGGENKYPAIAVEAGEAIALVTNQFNSFDFSAHDDDEILTGFITPALYEGEPWKIHTVDPFDYFAEPLKSELLAKNPRMAEPRGGKIDYDVAGTLAGNWFAEGTGYSGNHENYWTTHASFVYDHYDPSTITISLGNYGGEAKQFFAKGPDPAEVREETGIVKYELVDIDYMASGKRWDRISYAENIEGVTSNPVQGIVLVQLLGGERMKLEAFPGKTAGQVNGFTADAKVYER